MTTSEKLLHVYKFEIGYPNISNNACLSKLQDILNVYYGL